MPESQHAFFSFSALCEHLRSLEPQSRGLFFNQYKQDVKPLLASGYHYQTLWRLLPKDTQDLLYEVFHDSILSIVIAGGGLGAVLKCLSEQQQVQTVEAVRATHHMTDYIKSGSDLAMILKTSALIDHETIYTLVKPQLLVLKWTVHSFGSFFHHLSDALFLDGCLVFKNKLNTIAPGGDSIFKLLLCIPQHKLERFLNSFVDEFPTVSPSTSITHQYIESLFDRHENKTAMSILVNDFKKLPSRSVALIFAALGYHNADKFVQCISDYEVVLARLGKRHRPLFMAAFKTPLIQFMISTDELRVAADFLKVNELLDVCKAIANDDAFDFGTVTTDDLKQSFKDLIVKVRMMNDAVKPALLKFQVTALGCNVKQIKESIDDLLKRTDIQATNKGCFSFFKKKDNPCHVQLIHYFVALPQVIQVKINQALALNIPEHQVSSQALRSVLEDYVKNICYNRSVDAIDVAGCVLPEIQPLPAMPMLAHVGRK